MKNNNKKNKVPHYSASLTALLLLYSCTPKIQLETPKEGITVNLNVEVDHRIKIETDDNTRRILTPQNQDKKQPD